MNDNEFLIKCFKNIGINKKIKLPHIENVIIVRLVNMIGIAIEYDRKENYYEEFNKIVLKTTFLNDGKKYLCLLIDKHICYLESFTLICNDFIEEMTGNEAVLLNPLLWVDKWKELLGNKLVDKKMYELLGELISYYYCKKNDFAATWNINKASTHDIETENNNFEIKSSIIKKNTIVHINSKFQLAVFQKPTYLFFLRFENSLDGISINDVINKFDKKEKNNILCSLNKAGYKLENHSFNEKYKLLEMRKYRIDSDFPILKTDDIHNDKLKQHLLNFNYEISLDSLKFEEIKGDFLND